MNILSGTKHPSGAPKKKPLTNDTVDIQNKPVNVTQKENVLITKPNYLNPYTPPQNNRGESKKDFTPYSLPGQYSKRSIPLTPRREMEEKCRTMRRNNEQCPFVNEQGLCTQPNIRCVDRSLLDSDSTQKGDCLYHPNISGDNILIVESDTSVLQVCTNIFKRYSFHKRNKIYTATCKETAMSHLKQIKEDNGRLGLAIIAGDLASQTGYNLIDYLYVRNYCTEIILLQPQQNKSPEPLFYNGNKEVGEGKRFVSYTLEKPFSPYLLIDIIKNIPCGSFI